MEDDFDYLYEDLAEPDKETERERKYRLKSEELEEKNRVLQERINLLMELNKKLTVSNTNIQRNMSALTKTARIEINRKNAKITELKRELENVIMRRSLKLGTKEEYEQFLKVLRVDSRDKVQLPIPGGKHAFKDDKEIDDCEFPCCLKSDIVVKSSKEGTHMIVCGNTAISFAHHQEEEGPKKRGPYIYVRLDDGTFVRRRKAPEGTKFSKIVTPEEDKILLQKEKEAKLKEIEDKKKLEREEKRKKEEDSDKRRRTEITSRKRKLEVPEDPKKKRKLESDPRRSRRQSGEKDRHKHYNNERQRSRERHSHSHRSRECHKESKKTNRTSNVHIEAVKSIFNNEMDSKRSLVDQLREKEERNKTKILARSTIPEDENAVLESPRIKEATKDDSRESGELDDDDDDPSLTQKPNYGKSPSNSKPDASPKDLSSPAGIASILRGNLVVSPKTSIISSSPSVIGARGKEVNFQNHFNSSKRNEVTPRRSPSSGRRARSNKRETNDEDSESQEKRNKERRALLEALGLDLSNSSTADGSPNLNNVAGNEKKTDEKENVDDLKMPDVVPKLTPELSEESKKKSKKRKSVLGPSSTSNVNNSFSIVYDG